LAVYHLFGRNACHQRRAGGGTQQAGERRIDIRRKSNAKQQIHLGTRHGTRDIVAT
jgi:hypothetical protein